MSLLFWMQAMSSNQTIDPSFEDVVIWQVSEKELYLPLCPIELCMYLK